MSQFLLTPRLVQSSEPEELDRAFRPQLKVMSYICKKNPDLHVGLNGTELKSFRPAAQEYLISLTWF